MTENKKLQYNKDEDYYYGGTPFKITVTGHRRRPYWVSPKNQDAGPLKLRDIPLYNPITYIMNYLSGNNDNGTFINLSDKYMRQITSRSKNVSGILANEFVENRNNTVRKKSNFVNTNDTLLGDHKMPLSNFSVYYGIEDGKLKAGPLNIFLNETTVVPNRMKSTGKIKHLVPRYNFDLLKQILKKNGEIEDSILSEYNAAHGYKQDWFDRLIDAINPWSGPPSPRRILAQNIGHRNASAVSDSIVRPHLQRNPYGENLAITETGDTVYINQLNASPKIMFADENGNAAFVSNLYNKQNLDSLNTFLERTPSYPIMVDNGRFSNYDVSRSQYYSPNPYLYSGFKSPDDMYIIGY